MGVKEELKLEQQVLLVMRLSMITATNLGILVDKMMSKSSIDDMRFNESLNKMVSALEDIMKEMKEI